ncbi:MAG: hypothetical protein IJF04_02755 [Oscillospiraceae bacterium]|nr:hypothetical protein [Oscillospiraceae bacterium]MBQ3237348.1 hypothetical protein [Oscillospiraceae bacterium]MBQ6801793.1 hypothetical protein [Oscillospiraceae bacterium]
MTAEYKKRRIWGVLHKEALFFCGGENACKGFGVATLSISYYDIGYIAGEMAYEILVNGANPGEMEIRYAPEVIKKYNAEICSELGITPPADYVVIG